MSEIPKGICRCGCGRRTRIATVNNKSKGWVKGEPLKYLHHHGQKGRRGSPQAQTCSMFNDWPVAPELVCDAWEPKDSEAVSTDGEDS